jgi:hypothetical protein
MNQKTLVMTTNESKDLDNKSSSTTGNKSKPVNDETSGIKLAKLSPKDYSHVLSKLDTLFTQFTDRSSYLILPPQFEDFKVEIDIRNYFKLGVTHEEKCFVMTITDSKDRMFEILFRNQPVAFDIGFDNIPYRECITYIDKLVDYFNNVETYLKHPEVSSTNDECDI